MRLVTFQNSDRSPRLGALLDDRIVDLADAADALNERQGAEFARLPDDMVDFFAAGDGALHAAQDVLGAVADAIARGDELLSGERPIRHSASDVRLCAPVPRPPRIRDYLTYEAHATGSGLPVPEAFRSVPICYECNTSTILGPDDPIAWPAYSRQLDFELEVGFFVGRGGRNISVDDAPAHIAGVTIFNDVSARDIQFYEMSLGIGPSKGKSFATVMGPCVVTMDEVDEFAIECSVRVNGETWSKADTAGRRYSFAEVLAWASYCESVQPGEFLAVGTVAGGCGLELDRWIAPGDVVELEASGIGVLRNVVDQPEQVPDGAGIPSYTGAPRAAAKH
ncbi:fumarylacetoacetate hydrolase family protein [Gordonia sp. TBRC 11910]|uniref:Fumarylacetoacetate hydrolase family protein n=1 Tax=Gordonia asplenii TaxID=2725283 RepID=A0A848KZS4_9ACTN|nr:fumarylacetoacetate hydrolase family protein [Gordonia asplenii]NMO01701.1 fumarylacetoacetate hydrolase family protein [Gordonia asplenii]